MWVALRFGSGCSPQCRSKAPALHLMTSASVLDLVDGADDARFGELPPRRLGEVVRKNDKVGILARLQFTLLPFLKFSVGGAGGIDTRQSTNEVFSSGAQPFFGSPSGRSRVTEKAYAT